MVNKKTTKMTWKDFKRIPWWTWLFIVSCILLPITTIGGAIPATVAMVGIILCVKISLLPSIKPLIKLLLCLSITSMTWVFGYLSVWGLAKML